jgi:hypothetical protein
MIVPKSLWGGGEKEMATVLSAELGMSLEDFQKYFDLEHAKRSDDILLKVGFGITKNLRNSDDLSDTGKIRKRFKQGTNVELGLKLIESLNQEVEEARVRNQNAERITATLKKIGQLLNPIIETYDEDNENNTSGFSIDWNPYTIYDSSWKREGDEDSGFKLKIHYSPKVLFERDSKSRIIDRYPDLLDVTINKNGAIGKVDFNFKHSTGWKYQEILRDMSSLENLIKVTDSAIEWQIDILEFANKIKNEINPEVWDLAKTL